MGALLSLLLRRRRDLRILMIGLDSSGKTTILYRLRIGEVVTTSPTIGFNVEEVTYRSLKMVVWDVGGQDKLRPLWRHYYQGSHALVFVVDSSDAERLDEARDELHKALRDTTLAKVPLLVFSNKIDLPRAVPADQLVDRLELRDVKDRLWYVQASSATNGQGVYEGMEWLAKQLEGK
jgi:small GTP-binding protein